MSREDDVKRARLFFLTQSVWFEDEPEDTGRLADLIAEVRIEAAAAAYKHAASIAARDGRADGLASVFESLAKEAAR
jgi:hypothetical protein